ncbi:hypothetical protein CCH79_00009344 [Gambusia affinis]|uniref:Uncharacterized protein n=1 Tax=Gambusia affinis TaxID=33528 RepID=A0A315WHI6_GAMAF|nr:hypothetical protein CCH79_00009344 [Gambusia affinis]
MCFCARLFFYEGGGRRTAAMMKDFLKGETQGKSKKDEQGEKPLKASNMRTKVSLALDHQQWPFSPSSQAIRGEPEQASQTRVIMYNSGDGEQEIEVRKETEDKSEEKGVAVNGRAVAKRDARQEQRAAFTVKRHGIVPAISSS